MSEEFTPEEWKLIRHSAADRGSFSHASFFAAALFAPIVFAIYGTVQRDFVAILVAFLGLLLLLGWFVVAAFRNSKLLASICSKLIAARH